MKSKKGVKTEKSAKSMVKPSNDKKAQINNQIIQFQGKFKQAKVAIIRKLVQKLKHPEKNPKQNLAAKAERYENVLNQLKHTSPKRLGVLALLYYKSGKNYLADQNSTIDQLMIGYFSEHKGLSALLDMIRNKLNLNETSTWKKPAKKLFRKKDKTAKPEKSTKSTKSDKTKASSTEIDNPDASAKLKPKKQKQNKSSEKADKGAKIANKTSESEESDSSNESEEDNELNEEKVIEAPTTVDDFFITADGSNYLSTAVSNKVQDNDSGDDSNAKKVFEKKPREASFFHKSDKRPVRLASNRFEGTKRKWPNESVEPVQAAKEPKVDPELHPSWQAKQKLKPTITAFKGTKITFD